MKVINRYSILFSFFFIYATVTAQEINIIPKPQSIKQSTIAASFTITPATQLVPVGSQLDKVVSFFNNYLQANYLFKLKIVKDPVGKNVIRLNYERMDHPIPGAYGMTVDENGIYIAGDNETGVFYGIQSLIQLLPVPNAKLKLRPGKLSIPHLSVQDAPRFAYRGMHLDCGRHFWSVAFIKKYIDYLALHKFNTFHWHLTEDQGWRIEIKKYPKLTAVGGWRKGTIIGRYPGSGNDGIKYGGFYTQEEIKEVVNYASKRFIEVIPEIEMPGHSSAAIAAYPELSCFPDEPTIKYFPKQCTWNGDSSGKQVQQTWGVFDDVFCAGQERTFSFLEDVMDEVLALFPSKYVHVGGDECPKENWKRCPHCQQRIKEKGLKDEHELQSYFIQRMEKYLNSRGRTLIGWDEILEGGLAPNAVVMSWRGEKGGIEAAKEKHYVIMTPGNPVYFDHTQSENEDSVTIGGYNPIEKVYAYEPIPKELTEEEGNYVLGAQANVWTEYMKNTKKVEYMIFPRMAALSEVLWCKKENKNWEDFERRLMGQFKRYEFWKANYSKAYFDLKAGILPAEDRNHVLWKLQTKLKGAEIKYITHYAGRPYPLKFSEGKSYKSPIEIGSTMLVAAISLLDGKTISNPVYETFHFNKATGKTISLAIEASPAYPGDGAFTLVNGVINEKGFARTREFLGFNGTDCEAVIDLGESKEISFVVVNCLDRRSSWIWRPQSAEVFGSGDGQSWYPLKATDNFQSTKPVTGKGMMTLSFRKTFTRYIKVLVKNWGTIPAGNPGAGNKAWMFVDEIEVD